MLTIPRERTRLSLKTLIIVIIYGNGGSMERGRRRMKVEEFRNYGKGFMNTMAAPEFVKRTNKLMMRESRRELGLIGLLRMGWRMRKETRRMKKHDWSKLRERGFTAQGFLDRLIAGMAAMKALADMLRMERASEVYRRIWDRIAYDLMTSVFPSVEEFNACGDAFKAFKEYMKAVDAANERAGLYEVDIVEDTDDVFVCNYKYCVWHELAKEFGDPYLCYPANCYLDEVWIPRFATEGGWKFKRTGTLATGAPVCDFRFERLHGGNEPKRS